jgi:hypothetical protein
MCLLLQVLQWHLPTEDAKRVGEVALEIPGVPVRSSSGKRGSGKRPDIDSDWAKRWPMMICGGRLWEKEAGPAKGEIGASRSGAESR